jgi:hypothetical protein
MSEDVHEQQQRKGTRLPRSSARRIGATARIGEDATAFMACLRGSW